VLGCATGEEAYSIGSCCRAHGENGRALQVQIFAPISMAGACRGRVGRYRTSIADDMSGTLARWFVREGDNYCVVKNAGDVHPSPAQRHQGRAVLKLTGVLPHLLIYLNGELQIASFRCFTSPAVERFLFLAFGECDAASKTVFAGRSPGRIFRKLRQHAAGKFRSPLPHSTRSYGAGCHTQVSIWAEAARTYRRSLAPPM